MKKIIAITAIITVVLFALFGEFKATVLGVIAFLLYKKFTE